MSELESVKWLTWAERVREEERNLEAALDEVERAVCIVMRARVRVIEITRRMRQLERDDPARMS